MLLAARLLQGMAVGALGVAANQHLLRDHARGQCWGGRRRCSRQGSSLGASLGPFFGGVLADLGDLRTPFWAQAVLSMALIPVILAVMQSGRTEVRSVRASLSDGPATCCAARSSWACMALAFALFFLRAGARNALLPAYADEVGACRRRRSAWWSAPVR